MNINNPIEFQEKSRQEEICALKRQNEVFLTGLASLSKRVADLKKDVDRSKEELVRIHAVIEVKA